MHRTHILTLLLGALIALVSASTPTFCKCTCFKNSTIIPLGPQHKDPPLFKNLEMRSPPADSHAAPVDSSSIQRRAASSSCSQCTKAFCLNHGIDFCLDAKEEDVQTMCFQRDSVKDQILVWSFIVSTCGLLGWAAVKKVLEMRGGGVSPLGT